MSENIKKQFENLIPFIIIGIAVALVISLLVMFSYVVVWGVIIGAVLWLIFLIKDYFFPEKAAKKSRGKVIDHNDSK